MSVKLTGNPLAYMQYTAISRLAQNIDRANRAYPENTNFETFVPRNLKFHRFVDLHTTKKCRIST